LQNDKDHKVVIVGGPNPKRRAATILKKTVKSPYLRNRLTNFDEIWQDNAHWLLTADQPQ